MLEEVVSEFGPQNMVQEDTDNATTYGVERKLFEERFPAIFWTPCVAHYIDLTLIDR